MSSSSLKKRYQFLAYIILLILIASYTAGCSEKARYLSKGRKYIAAQDWDKSVRYFQKAYEESPDDPEVKLLLIKSKAQASDAHMRKGEQILKLGMHDDAIIEFQTSVAFNPANEKAVKLIEKGKRLKDVAYYVKQGKFYFEANKYLQARKVFQKVIKLDPDNEAANKYLGLYLKKTDRPPRFRLKLKSDGPISLKFKKTPIMNVFEILSKISGVNFIFDKHMKDSKVTLFMTDVTFDKFLDVLLRTNNLDARMVNSTTMIIFPDTPLKAKEYNDLQIRTFYLANIKAKKMVSLMVKILRTKDIYANEKLNSVVVRGTKELISLASTLIDANDVLPAEVLLNVEFLEIERTKERQLGLEFSDSLTLGLKESTDETDRITVYDLNRLSNKDLLVSIPSATLNLLKQDTDTRTLSKPQIRVKNQEKSTIHIGDRVPLRTNRRTDTNGAVSYDFQYQDVGIKLDAEPTINMHDEVTIKMSLEVSALGANVGTTDDPQFSIKTRKAKTVLTLRDGETIIIGGLITDEEKETVRKIPILGDLPLIGRLFRTHGNDDSAKDILMVMTPVVTRSQELPSVDIMQFWSGKEKNFSLEEPYESYLERKEKYKKAPNRKDVINFKKSLKKETSGKYKEKLRKTAIGG